MARFNHLQVLVPFARDLLQPQHHLLRLWIQTWGRKSPLKATATVPTNLITRCGFAINRHVCQSLVQALYQAKGGLKPATAINVRHILCEKQSKALEALEKIQV